VCSGFKEVIGSWKIMPMRRPRMVRMKPSSRPSSSWPSKRMLPESCHALG
jgi:hypothetical protein